MIYHKIHRHAAMPGRGPWRPQASLSHRMVCCSHRSAARAAAATAASTAAAATTAAADPTPGWSSCVSRRVNMELAVEEAVEGARAGHPEAWEPELAIVFLSSAYVAEYRSLVDLLRSKVPSLRIITGSTGYGVIGSTTEGPEEIEHAPALSLTLGSLPGTSLSLSHIGQQLPDGDAPPEEWAQLLGVDLHSSHPTNFIILAEPEFSKLTELTDGLDFAFPAANKIGGLISSGKLSAARSMFAWSSEQQYTRQPARQQGQQGQQGQQQQDGQGDNTAAAEWPSVLRTGAVVLAMQGPVEMELLIAQGCRPLSDAIYTVEAVADGGGPVVVTLRDERGRKVTPLEALQRELQKVASSRTELMQMLRNMALGVLPDVLRVADSPAPEAHDFLIRGMALNKAGFMIVGDSVRVGQRVRFMVRDREGAQQDLTSHCLAYKRRELQAMLGGSSLFASSSSSSNKSSTTTTTSSSSSSSAEQPQSQQPAGQEQQQPEPSQQPEPQQPEPQQPEPQRRAFGMLLFSCNGRGMNLYNEPSWDSRTLASYIPVPVSGFMCNGELGSLGGATHLHGFTCAAAVLRAITPAAQAAEQQHTADAAQDSRGSRSSGGSSSSEAAGTGRLEPGEDRV